MKRISTAVLLLLFASQVPAVNVWNQWKEYETWAQAYRPESAVALAQAPDGSVTYEWGATTDMAENRALRECKRRNFPYDSRTCRIVDVNFKSKGKLSTTAPTPGSNPSSAEGDQLYCHDSEYNLFYKGSSNGCVSSDKEISKREFTNRRFSSITTGTSTSGPKSVWCVAESSVFESTKAYCQSKGLKSFPTKHRAESERRRLAVSNNGVIGILIFSLFATGAWILKKFGGDKSRTKGDSSTNSTSLLDISGLHDAFTGVALNRALGLFQCTKCKVFYHRESINALKEHNSKKCINCQSNLIIHVSS
jgi:hypothetical protein